MQTRDGMEQKAILSDEVSIQEIFGRNRRHREHLADACKNREAVALPASIERKHERSQQISEPLRHGMCARGERMAKLLSLLQHFPEGAPDDRRKSLLVLRCAALADCDLAF